MSTLPNIGTKRGQVAPERPRGDPENRGQGFRHRPFRPSFIEPREIGPQLLPASLHPCPRHLRCGQAAPSSTVQPKGRMGEGRDGRSQLEARRGGGMRGPRGRADGSRQLLRPPRSDRARTEGERPRHRRRPPTGPGPRPAGRSWSTTWRYAARPSAPPTSCPRVDDERGRRRTYSSATADSAMASTSAAHVASLAAASSCALTGPF